MGDPRASGAASLHGSLASHSHWISAVEWASEGSEHTLLSTSHDGTLKLWDTRAAVPLATLDGGLADFGELNAGPGTSSTPAQRTLAGCWWRGSASACCGGTTGRLYMY